MTDDAPGAPHDAPPLTRRELRERERAAEAAAAASSAEDEDEDEDEGIDDLASTTSTPVTPAPAVMIAEPVAPAPLEATGASRAATAADPAASVVSVVPVETDADAEIPRARRGGFGRALLNGIGIGLLAIIVGLAVVTVIIPRATGATPLTVLTGSMEPSLPPGTLVVVRPKPVDQIRIGDVVTYEPNPNDPKELVTHRVVAITSGTDGSTVFTVKGDNNSAADAPVQSKQIVAVLWYSVPWFGWVNSLLGSSGTGSLLLPAVAVLLIAYAIWAIFSGGRERRRAKAASAE